MTGGAGMTGGSVYDWRGSFDFGSGLYIQLGQLDVQPATFTQDERRGTWE